MTALKELTKVFPAVLGSNNGTSVGSGKKEMSRKVLCSPQVRLPNQREKIAQIQRIQKMSWRRSLECLTLRVYNRRAFSWSRFLIIGRRRYGVVHALPMTVQCHWKGPVRTGLKIGGPDGGLQDQAIGLLSHLPNSCEKRSAWLEHGDLCLNSCRLRIVNFDDDCAHL